MARLGARRTLARGNPKKSIRHLHMMRARSADGKGVQGGKAIPPLGQLQAALFDVDGTLCESDPLHYEVFRELLSELGLFGGEPISWTRFRQEFSGRHNPELFAELFPEKEEEERERLAEEKERRYRALLSRGISPLPGTHEFLSLLHGKGVPCVAVTNAPRKNAEEMLGAMGLSDHFAGRLIVGSECQRPKPFPDPYVAAAERAGASELDKCVAFEDSLSGVESAISAGMACVGMLTSQPEKTLLNAGCSLATSSFNDPRLFDAFGASTVPSD